MTKTNRYFASIAATLLVAATGCASNMDENTEATGEVQSANIGASAAQQAPSAIATTAESAAKPEQGLRGAPQDLPVDPTFKSFDDVSQQQLEALAGDVVFSSPIFLDTFPRFADLLDFDLGGAITPASTIDDCVSIERGNDSFKVRIQCVDPAGSASDGMQGEFDCGVSIPDGDEILISCSVGLTEDRTALEGNVDLKLDRQGKRTVTSRFVNEEGHTSVGTHHFRRVNGCTAEAGRVLYSTDEGDIRMAYDDVLRCAESCVPSQGAYRVSAHQHNPAAGEVPKTASLQRVDGVWLLSTDRGTSVAHGLCR